MHTHAFNQGTYKRHLPTGDSVNLGVRGLDEEIGGIPRGSMIAVTGWIGTGKTTLEPSFWLKE